MMKRFRKHLCRMICLMIALSPVYATAETTGEETEQGLDEIQPLIEISDVNETEGMSLEEMTDAFTESVMSEYYDGASGFSMQYPSIFQFDEGGEGTLAVSSDRKASMAIENMANQGSLNEEELIRAIQLEIPEAKPQKNKQNGCLRFDRTTDNGKTGQTDLYLLTEHSFHHIVLRYPSEEQEIYDSYIEYMINTMETNETDQG